MIWVVYAVAGEHGIAIAGQRRTSTGGMSDADVSDMPTSRSTNALATNPLGALQSVLTKQVGACTESTEFNMCSVFVNLLLLPFACVASYRCSSV